MWLLTEVVWGHLWTEKTGGRCWQHPGWLRCIRFGMWRNGENCLWKAQRNLDWQLGSGSYVPVVWILTLKLSRRKCSQPQPLFTFPNNQVGDGFLRPALVRGSFLCPEPRGWAALEITGVLVISSWHSKVCFRNCSKRSPFPKSVLRVCALYHLQKDKSRCLSPSYLDFKLIEKTNCQASYITTNNIALSVYEISI